jgi:hypothetical protein
VTPTLTFRQANLADADRLAAGITARFYEREGWAQEGEPHEEPELGMAIVEYRRALS